MTSDTSAAIHAINARLGLDSSLGLFGMGATSRAYQSLDGGPRSISMGALGQNRQTFFGGANGTPSFGAVSTGIASQQQQAMNKAMTQAMLSQLVGTNQSGTANGRASPKVVSAGPAVSMEATAAHAPQEVSKGVQPAAHCPAQVHIHKHLAFQLNGTWAPECSCTGHMACRISSI